MLRYYRDHQIDCEHSSTITFYLNLGWFHIKNTSIRSSLDPFH